MNWNVLGNRRQFISPLQFLDNERCGLFEYHRHDNLAEFSLRFSFLVKVTYINLMWRSIEKGQTPCIHQWILLRLFEVFSGYLEINCLKFWEPDGLERAMNQCFKVFNCWRGKHFIALVISPSPIEILKKSLEIINFKTSWL